MYIDRESRKLLRQLLKMEPDEAGLCFSIDLLQEKFENTLEDILRIFDSLVSKGLASRHNFSNGELIGYSLTQDGKAYKEYHRQEAISRWMERIVSFGLGIAAVVLTWFITGTPS